MDGWMDGLQQITRDVVSLVSQLIELHE